MMQDIEGTWGLAAQADPFRLYELAVQCPESEVHFIDQQFRRLRGREPRSLREDFCGTAALCWEWVTAADGRTAVGVDKDPRVLAWSKAKHGAGFPDTVTARVTLLEQDVLAVEPQTVDVLAAFNFSYWLFADRTRLLDYLRRARAALGSQGVLFLDAYGGYDAPRVITEERSVEHGDQSFTYVWEQQSYDPISGAMDCHIHFGFPDGSQLERAFSYRWRLWNLPDLRDLLHDAGFSSVTVYWQGWTEDGEPDGIFRPADTGEPDAGWIAYITALP